MAWTELVLTIIFSVLINITIEYLETNPGYSCPISCEVDHDHFVDNADFVHFTVVEVDSLFWIALPDSDLVVGILKAQ